MLTERQKFRRLQGITSTDIRAIVGLDPNGRTAHDVFISKLGLSQPFEETEAMRWGNRLERFIVEDVAAFRKLALVPCEPEALTSVHPKHALRIATPDALYAAPSGITVAVGESKVVGPWATEGWGESESDEVPDWVRVQVSWECDVREVPVGYVGALFGLELRHYEVPADEELIGVLGEEAERFWIDHVVPRRSPAIDGSAGSRRMVESVFAKQRVGVRASVVTDDILADEYFAAKAEQKLIEDRVELATQALMRECGDAEGIQGKGWRLFWKWREEAEVAYTRKSYRHLDIRKTKGKSR